MISLNAFRHFGLIMQLVRRDIAQRYSGSFLGFLWAIANPLMLLAIYSLVFGRFMRARWPGAEDSGSFALILFAGLIVFNLFAECVSRSPTLIVTNPNFVKKVVFPLEKLVFVPIGAALFNFCLSLAAWIFIALLVNHSLHWTVVLLPVVLLPFVVMLYGISLFLSGVGVFVRDVSHVTGLAVQMLMFLSPVLYPLSNVPARFAWLFMLNPITLIVQQTRDVMLAGVAPNFLALAIYLFVAIFICFVSSVFFKTVRPGFADTL